jgi:Mg-chelatase subunit ChlD
MVPVRPVATRQRGADSPRGGGEEGIMIFDRPWALLLLCLPAIWVVWDWRSPRRTALLLKAAALACVALALAQPRVFTFESKVALAVLTDTSASVSGADLERESQLVNQIERRRGGNWMQVMPFARTTRNVSQAEHKKTWNLGRSEGAAGRGTNLEAAIREGIANLPTGMVPRVLLVSDGNENLGSVTRAIWQAQQLHVPIDTVALEGRPKPSLEIESISMPSHVFTGEKFPIEIAVRSPKAVRASVELFAEGKSLGVSRADLAPGLNHISLHTGLSAIGAIDIAGKIGAPQLGEARFEEAVTIRRPRVLLLSKDPVGTETHLMHALEANQFDVDRESRGVPDKLDNYQLVVINNWDLQTISDARKADLEKFEQEGGGIALIAGEHNIYVDKKQEDALERALPAKLAPPRTPEGTAVVLIIDKSSSMEGKKIELARLAAIGVVDNLRPIDTVGVLIFDNSFQWAVQPRKADDKSSIKRLIAGITPDGGTQIAPALTEAYHKILPVNAAYKHIVLLTDGISEEGDSMSLSKEAQNNRVTISTVGLGQDVNRAFLEKVAQQAQGKSYFLNDPSGLEQILLRDVMEHTGSTAVEKNIRPTISKQAEILDGVAMDTVPVLHGYVRFQARPSADTILKADPKDPLLVRWQYGLGRSAVFTSDAKARWASNWVTWSGFDRLWTNIFRDLLPHAQASEATAEYDSANGELVIDYHLSHNVDEPATVPQMYALGSNNFQMPVTVSKVSSGHYRVQAPIGQTQGLIRVRPLEESRAFPEVGFYRQEDELAQYGSNPSLLRKIAVSTGGHFNPAPQAVFDAAGRTIPSSVRLWPGLLALAILLDLTELILRKWKGLMEFLPLRRAARAAA